MPTTAPTQRGGGEGGRPRGESSGSIPTATVGNEHKPTRFTPSLLSLDPTEKRSLPPEVSGESERPSPSMHPGVGSGGDRHWRRPRGRRISRFEFSTAETTATGRQTAAEYLRMQLNILFVPIMILKRDLQSHLAHSDQVKCVAGTKALATKVSPP